MAALKETLDELNKWNSLMDNQEEALIKLEYEASIKEAKLEIFEENMRKLEDAFYRFTDLVNYFEQKTEEPIMFDRESHLKELINIQKKLDYYEKEIDRVSESPETVDELIITLANYQSKLNL